MSSLVADSDTEQLKIAVWDKDTLSDDKMHVIAFLLLISNLAIVEPTYSNYPSFAFLLMTARSISGTIRHGMVQ